MICQIACIPQGVGHKIDKCINTSQLREFIIISIYDYDLSPELFKHCKESSSFNVIVRIPNEKIDFYQTMSLLLQDTWLVVLIFDPLQIRSRESFRLRNWYIVFLRIA